MGWNQHKIRHLDLRSAGLRRYGLCLRLRSGFGLCGFLVARHSTILLRRGTAEGARLDNSFKYTGAYGPVRASLLYQLPDAPGKGAYDGQGGGSSIEADLGTTIQNLSVDVAFSQVNDALFVTTLSAEQLLTNPQNSLAATASDNTAVAVGASYKIGKLTLLGGYQNIRFTNPGDPVADGADDYGYELSVVNDTAYIRNKVLQYLWFGGHYAVTPKLTLRAGYYYEFRTATLPSPAETPAARYAPVI